MVRSSEMLEREVYRIYATEEEEKMDLNATRVENGKFYAKCADIDATNMADIFEVLSVLFRGWYVPEGSPEQFFRIFYVQLDLGQFTYGQLRNGELKLSDLVYASWHDVYEISLNRLKEGDLA